MAAEIRCSPALTDIAQGQGISSVLATRLARAARILRPTPTVALRDDHIDLHAKLEFLNGIGSVKDRSAFWVLKGAIERGEIGPNTTVIESSSGNFACALAVFCRVLGLRFIPVIDPNISSYYEATLRAQCERVVRVTEPDDTGGYLKTRIRTVHELIESIPDSYWPNQYKNRDAMAAHFNLTADEILRTGISFDYVFLGVGSAGTIAGVSQRLRQEPSCPRIVAVDIEGSMIFGTRPKKRLIPGIGSSIQPPLLREALIDDVVTVSEVSVIQGCSELWERHGLFAGGSSGAVYAAVQKYFDGRRLPHRPRVLFLCCDRGTAYLTTVYDAQWARWRADLELELQAEAST